MQFLHVHMLAAWAGSMRKLEMTVRVSKAFGRGLLWEAVLKQNMSAFFGAYFNAKCESYCQHEKLLSTQSQAI